LLSLFRRGHFALGAPFRGFLLITLVPVCAPCGFILPLNVTRGSACVLLPFRKRDRQGRKYPPGPDEDLRIDPAQREARRRSYLFRRAVPLVGAVGPGAYLFQQ
jgi:hypothetical protein